MAAFVTALVMALLAIYWLAIWIRVLRQNARTAIQRVHAKLDAAEKSGLEGRIPLKSAYPLSAGMVKEIARMRGWHYIGGGGSEGVSKLRFTFEGLHSQEAHNE